MRDLFNPKPRSEATCELNPNCANEIMKRMLDEVTKSHNIIRENDKFELINPVEVSLMAHLVFWHEKKFPDDEEQLMVQTEDFDTVLLHTLFMHYDTTWFDYFDIVYKRIQERAKVVAPRVFELETRFLA